MKYLLFLLSLSLNFSACNTGPAKQVSQTARPEDKLQVVEASCGQCNFNLKGDGCTLAVRMNGKAYFVDGSSIDDHGDAHAGDGFCETIRKAEVRGYIKNDRFQAQYFRLIPVKATP